MIRYADDRPETYQLPGAALFDTNSSTVRPQALPLLNDVAVRARTTPAAGSPSSAMSIRAAARTTTSSCRRHGRTR